MLEKARSRFPFVTKNGKNLPALAEAGEAKFAELDAERKSQEEAKKAAKKTGKKGQTN